MPPCFALNDIHSPPFTRLRQAKSGLRIMSAQNGSRIRKAGFCVSLSASGTENVSTDGTFSHQLEYQRQPPCRSSNSYTPYRTPLSLPASTSRRFPFTARWKASRIRSLRDFERMTALFPSTGAVATGSSTPVMRFVKLCSSCAA